jgi:transposase
VLGTIEHQNVVATQLGPFGDRADSGEPQDNTDRDRYIPAALGYDRPNRSKGRVRSLAGCCLSMPSGDGHNWLRGVASLPQGSVGESTLICGRTNFDLLLLENKGQSRRVRKVGHNRLGNRGGITPDFVEVDAHSELFGAFLPLWHRKEGGYLSIYVLRRTPSIYLDTPRLSIYLDMLYTMTAPAETDLRITRAREIASHPETVEKLEDGVWSVPSQSGFGRYRVWFVGEAGRCTCPDFSKRMAACKHIFAVTELQLREMGKSLQPALPKSRKQYRQHQSYTKGQTEEMRTLDSLLRDLVDMVPEHPRSPGLPGPTPIPLKDAIYCAVLKVYSGLSGRRACGVYQNVSDRGLLVEAPSFMVASRALNRPEATRVLYQLLSMSAAPLAGLEDGGAVAPDSTGVQTTSFGAWREEKHGEKRARKWLKVHAMVGTKTHVILRAVVSEKNSGDSPEFEPMLRGVIEDGFHPNRVVADKGYLSADNYAVADALGVEALIPFKANTLTAEVNQVRGVTKPESWNKAYHLFQANRAEFDRRYHARSNVESVFSALKRKFGENVRSKNTLAQVNEILCKLIAYNLTVLVHEMYENGIAPTFSVLNGN